MLHNPSSPKLVLLALARLPNLVGREYGPIIFDSFQASQYPAVQLPPRTVLTSRRNNETAVTTPKLVS